MPSYKYYGQLVLISALAKHFSFFSGKYMDIYLDELEDYFGQNESKRTQKGMNFLKRFISILSIICLLVEIGILGHLLTGFSSGNEGYGILISVIWSFPFYTIISLCVIALLIDMFSRSRELMTLTDILFFVTTLKFAVILYHSETNLILLIVCLFGVSLILLELFYSNHISKLKRKSKDK